jgi:hypothetical protein
MKHSKIFQIENSKTPSIIHKQIKKFNKKRAKWREMKYRRRRYRV